MGALIPLALTVAPEIAKWLFGDTAEKTTAAVSQAVQTVTGTADADAAATILQKDPAAAAQLRVQLAQIAAEQDKAQRDAEIDALSARLKDTADARSQTVTLAGQKSAIAWSASVISAIVLTTFGGVMALVLCRGLPPGSETAANLMLGTLAAMATSVVSYWVGSSAGSARKDNRLAQAATGRSGA